MAHKGDSSGATIPCQMKQARRWGRETRAQLELRSTKLAFLFKNGAPLHIGLCSGLRGAEPGMNSRQTFNEKP